MMPFMRLAGGASLREAPVILSETMIFPYLRGLVFCARLTNDGGWQALNDAYRRPPLSTEQILHPENTWPSPTRRRSWTSARSMRAQTGREAGAQRRRRDAARRAAPGGTAASRPRPAGTATATPSSRGPTAAWASSGSRRGTATPTPRSSPTATGPSSASKVAAGPDKPEPRADGGEPVRRGPCYIVERRGADVVVLEGFPPDLTDRLLQTAFKARKTEMTHNTPAKVESK